MKLLMYVALSILMVEKIWLSSLLKMLVVKEFIKLLISSDKKDKILNKRKAIKITKAELELPNFYLLS
jgi:ribosomal protein L17